MPTTSKHALDANATSGTSPTDTTIPRLSDGDASKVLDKLIESFDDGMTFQATVALAVHMGEGVPHHSFELSMRNSELLDEHGTDLDPFLAAGKDSPLYAYLMPFASDTDAIRQALDRVQDRLNDRAVGGAAAFDEACDLAEIYRQASAGLEYDCY